ncbi:unnamed protein product [Dicrocoelium dendriticum]|nr:unnamed protein product [Dicrocoelium dendriticum]
MVPAPHMISRTPWRPIYRALVSACLSVDSLSESRKIRTARILELALAENRCRLVRGRKFNEQQCPDLIPILTGEDTYVLFPYHGAVPASECRPDYDDSSHRSRWLVVLDGTWTQARHMLTGSPLLFALKRVCLPPNPLTGEFDRSQFVRRQPFSEAVCTVEAVSRILDLWEPPDSSRPTDFYQSRLLRPLHRILEVNLKCIRGCRRKVCDNTVLTCS